ncbi:MAG: DoxX family protein [Chloroflexota bacterium]
MSPAYWIAAGLLALVFLAAGAAKLLRPRSALRANMAWVDDFSDAQVKGIGALEVAGAAGVILPPLLGILPLLAPLAAAGLAIIQVGAAATHLRRGERPMIAANAVLVALAAIVAILGFGEIA